MHQRDYKSFTTSHLSVTPAKVHPLRRGSLCTRCLLVAWRLAVLQRVDFGDRGSRRSGVVSAASDAATLYLFVRIFILCGSREAEPPATRLYVRRAVLSMSRAQ
jgi:hypothetical protein